MLPNLITLLRLLLTLPIAVLIARGEAPGLTVTLLVLFGASDWVDGYLARRLHQTTRTGEILDPIADRVGIAVIVVALVAAGHLALWIALVIPAVDIGLAAAYAVVRPGRDPGVSRLGKARTAVLMGGLALIGAGLLPPLQALAAPGRVLCIAGAVLHAAAGLGYLRDLAGGPRA